MKKLTTQPELIDFLMQYKSVKTASFVSKTSLKMNKKDVATKTKPNPFDKINKVSVFKGEINFDYEDKVNDARFLEGKEQDFKAGEAVNGIQFISKALSYKDGCFYIKIIPENNMIDPVYEKEDGTKVDYKDLKEFIPVYKKPEGQELDKPVPFRTYKLDSIVYMKIDGVVEYIQE